MKRQALLISIITILFISIAIPVFAMDNVADGVRNFVGSTENVIENAGNNIAGGIRNGFNTLGQGTENVVTDVKDGMQETGNTMMGAMTDNNGNGGYTAERTAADDLTIAGMSTNTWTWVVVALSIVAIGILIWSYKKQRNKNDIYIDSNDMK